METSSIIFIVGAFLLGAIITFLFTKVSASSSPIISTPTMSEDTIKHMVNNYRENQLRFINSSLTVEDAHSVWHSMKDLRNFLNAIETESCKVNPNITEADLGVRFYYAAYPRSSEYGQQGIFNVPNDYELRHTMVMIPTIKKSYEGEMLDFDFNPLNPITYKIDNANLNTDKSARTLAMTTTGAPSMQVADNHGSLIPPCTTIGEIY